MLGDSKMNYTKTKILVDKIIQEKVDQNVKKDNCLERKKFYTAKLPAFVILSKVLRLKTKNRRRSMKNDP